MDAKNAPPPHSLHLNPLKATFSAMAKKGKKAAPAEAPKKKGKKAAPAEAPKKKGKKKAAAKK